MKKLFERYPVGVVLLLMLLCLSPFMAMRDVTPANELRYLSIADEAIREGHLFAFTNHGEPYADKPPLYFWILMLFRQVFGRHCVYFLSLFSFVPAALVTVIMDRWVYGTRNPATPRERAAMALMLASTGYWVLLSMFLRMDMLMVLFIVLALRAWYRNQPWGFALFTFLALFTKGPVGILMPVLVVLVYCLSFRVSASRRNQASDDPRLHLGRFLGWRFLLLVGGCCAVWFTGAWLDGGADYLRNLLFHQTVDRTFNAFHHKQPFWFYLKTIWPVMLPWCLLTIPACVASLCRRGETAYPFTEAGVAEKLFRCAFFVPLVMLSCSSGKLPIYLLPVFPFVIYLLPLYVRRVGWQRWMDWAIAVPAGLLALAALALMLEPFFFDRIPALAPYGFAKSTGFFLAGAFVLCGSVLTVVRALRSGRETASIFPLALAVPAFFLALALVLPVANDFLGYRELCRDIPEGVTVYVREHNRPENMDVYLGREVVVIEEGDPLPNDGVLVTKATFQDPSLEGRECHIHGESALWFPMETPDRNF